MFEVWNQISAAFEVPWGGVANICEVWIEVKAYPSQFAFAVCIYIYISRNTHITYYKITITYYTSFWFLWATTCGWGWICHMQCRKDVGRKRTVCEHRAAWPKIATQNRERFGASPRMFCVSGMFFEDDFFWHVYQDQFGNCRMVQFIWSLVCSKSCAFF